MSVIPNNVAGPQSVGHLTRKSGVLGSIPGLATYFRFSFRFFKKDSFSYWRKYVHEVLVNHLGGLSLPKKSVVRLTDPPDMTLAVTVNVKQQCNNKNLTMLIFFVKFMSKSKSLGAYITDRPSLKTRDTVIFLKNNL